MVIAVRAEATSNQSILDNSYGKYFPSGIVLNDFNYLRTNQMLSTPLFMKYATGDQIQLLNKYVQDLALANSYRRVTETVKLQDSKMTDDWISNIQNLQQHLLPVISDDLKKVSTMGE